MYSLLTDLRPLDPCPCRKKKAVHKTTSTDDKRLQNTLKRLGVNTIPGIEEVNIFQGDDVINFTNPKGGLISCSRLASSAHLDRRQLKSIRPYKWHSSRAADCCIWRRRMLL